MNVTPQQTRFEDIAHVDAHPETRHLLLMDKGWRPFLVDWPTGAQLALPRFRVPDPYHDRTQGWKVYTLGPSVLDLRLSEDSACILTTEGLWTCELREEAAWVRVAGHPTDPPEGMTLSNRASFGFRGPLARAHDRVSLRCGSRPVVLSADGSAVVGAPSLNDILGCAVDYTLELKMFTRAEPAPVTLPPRLRSEVSALAVSADGAVVAFSEGRDFRIIAQRQRRASQYKHKSMYVRRLALSPDGRFAAASGLYPDDLRVSPPRTVLWDVAGRSILDVVPDASVVGFVGRGEGTRLVLNLMKRTAPFPVPVQSALFIPGRSTPSALLPAPAVDDARGDTDFLVVRRAYEVQVMIAVELAAAADPRS